MKPYHLTLAMLALGYGLGSCLSLAAAAPPGREVVVALAEGSRGAWTRCAIAGMLTTTLARAADCANVEATMTCVLPAGDIVTTEWRGRKAGIYLLAASMAEPELVGRLETVSEVTAAMWRGIDATVAPDRCELELTDDHVLVVKWTTGRSK